jgi:hypothetical protein
MSYKAGLLAQRGEGSVPRVEVQNPVRFHEFDLSSCITLVLDSDSETAGTV